MKFLRLYIIGMCLFTSGCAAGWGKPYEVKFANSSTVTVEYDALLTDVGATQNAAQAECSIYGKDAVPAALIPDGAQVRDVVFDCVPRR